MEFGVKKCLDLNFLPTDLFYESLIMNAGIANLLLSTAQWFRFNLELYILFIYVEIQLSYFKTMLTGVPLFTYIC